MTDEELAAEHKALLAERTELSEEIGYLHQHPHDVPRHLLFSERLRQHRRGLRRHIAALHMLRFERNAEHFGAPVGRSVSRTGASHDGAPMIDEELAAEHQALLGEHATLEEEHRRLRGRPRDVEAHIRLGEKLHEHVHRLHNHVAGLHARVERDHS